TVAVEAQKLFLRLHRNKYPYPDWISILESGPQGHRYKQHVLPYRFAFWRSRTPIYPCRVLLLQMTALCRVFSYPILPYRYYGENPRDRSLHLWLLLQTENRYCHHV